MPTGHAHDGDPPGQTAAPAAAYPLEVPARRPARGTPAPAGRLPALIEVLLCSDIPTQLLIVRLLALTSLHPLDAGGQLSMGYVWTLSMLDSILLIGLILILLRLRGESARAMFLGSVRVPTEMTLGVVITPGIFLLAFGSLAAIQQYAPWLHTVPENPLAGLIDTPLEAALFVVVVVVAGGVREEVQRAFILTRFERHLGGAAFGLVVFSVAFGLGHLLQGWDTAIVTALLGAAWGLVYLRRRSILAPAVSHAAFDVSQILGYLATT